MTVASALKAAISELEAASIPEPAREARSLLAYILAVPETTVFAHPEHELAVDDAVAFEAVIARRVAREPFQYIVGRQEFFGLDFTVTPDVLIPRPETEILVEEAISITAANAVRDVCEIGVGSGCVSVAILANTRAKVTGGDVSEKALAIAAENAAKHGVADRLSLSVSDVFEGIPEQTFDLIVSNPPYVRADEFASLQIEVRDHEPRIALTDGEDGLFIIRRIVTGARDRLRTGGALLMEIGWTQSGEVREMLSGREWTDVKFLDDLQGIPRIVSARRTAN